jgi:hypothetical protein
MLEFLKNNIGSIAVLAVVVALLGLLTYSLIKNKKRGASCDCGCKDCPMSGKCKTKSK